MSEDDSDRSDMIRSAVITITFSVVFLIVGLTLWIWSAEDIIATSPVGALNSFNPYVTVIVEALTMLGMFIFLSVTVINLRLFLSEVRAGWLEVISIYLLVLVMAWLMFGAAVGGVTAILSLGFVVYLYLLQD